jgi:mannose-1-phosphate guanylyltransferase/mannose-6-phosphate isomerase
LGDFDRQLAVLVSLGKIASPILGKDNKMKIQPVILCGGSGTRLWPMSREQHPKQLLALLGPNTMLQTTAQRLDAAELAAGSELLQPLVVVNEEYRFATAEQLREVSITAAAILLEPEGRNTAPALTVAALAAVQEGEDPVLVVMPADHEIVQLAAFRSVVAQAVSLAGEGRLVTFGIPAVAPETGYGYIQRGSAIAGTHAESIARFVEKPDAKTAQGYVDSGDYYWNSGLFVTRASVWLAQIEHFRPDIFRSCRAAMAAAKRDKDFLRLDKDAFDACPSDSIDYAVMEKMGRNGSADVPVVLPLDAGWSDVGAWSALWELGNKDAHGNVFTGDVVAEGTERSFVRAESRLVACVGISDAVVVETPDAVLVAKRDQLHQLKKIVSDLKAAGRKECDAHRKVHRPWGCYDSVDAGPRFQVKRIVVKPGATLSKQMHHHRAEHWIVVVGTARVTCGDKTFLLSENESTYIPLGTLHRLENPGKVPLELIEVQSGSYLGEDDIVRFDDAYGRVSGPEKPLAGSIKTAPK